MKSTFNILLCLLMMFGVFVETDGAKLVSVMEGDSVTLNPDLTQLQRVNKILWTFGAQGSTIVEVNRNYNIYESDMMFAFRVNVNRNASLTIRNIRTSHSGLYVAKISHRTGTSYKKFGVIVYESPSIIDAGEAEIKSMSVRKGNSVTLETFPEVFGDELMLWGFGDEGILIAKYDTEATVASLYDAVDGKFRGRLHLHQTGALTIRNTRTTDSGLYQLKIMSGHTSYKKFRVTVSEPKKRVKKPTPDLGLSAVIGIVVAVLLVIAAAVISHRCMVFDQGRQMRRIGPKTVSVMEGQHVTLVTDVVIEDGEQVQWSFEGKTITTGMNGDINKNSYSDDERFRDRLELQHRTADLLIKDTKPSDAGVYQLQITSSSQKVIHRKYIVVVSGNRVNESSTDVVQSEMQSILMV